MVQRKKKFGVELYDDLNQNDTTSTQDFYASSDRIIDTIRPMLLTADREIRALDNKRQRVIASLEDEQKKREEAFPVQATNWKEKAKNAGKATSMAGTKAKIKTELAMLNTQVNAIKETFGLEMFDALDDLFQNSTALIGGHSSADDATNQIRTRFQSCKADIIEIKRKKLAKQQDIDALNVEGNLRRLS
eukprot:CAMPEP_0197250032 /NCGR_PEP_ID=MMETSP1429-20130617/50736_1 /TAXON_ID=49237 /ORGANISM="Chaetoceros  sp., Strain UNC1202" /LENGTH=189 /DNA_ID=CAMNT_0042711761 /DNA_START=26 /DNA_END=598 /DNA_ORIENTATION=+